MPSKVEELRKEIEKKLSKFEMDEVTVGEKTYPLYVFDKDEDINLFEGFLYANVNTKEEFSLLSNYKPPVSGYAGRIGIIIYKDHEIYIKDYRTNKQIRKTISKLNELFLKKLRKVLEEPKSENFSALFSRSDVIEEFYVLYKKSKEFLLDNINGISEEAKRKEFVDNFMMQMLTLWYLQEKGFFNRDKRYFITKFMDLKQKKLFGGFESYYAFLRHFFKQISGYSDEPYVEDESIGKCVVIGPAVFLNGEDNPVIAIPDKCFYQEGVTEKLVNLTPKGRRRTISEDDIDFDIPLLNLFESRDWVDGDIDEYVLGSLYEKLMTEDKRKKTGAYYTPEEITSYICKNTIEPYLVDRINEEFGKDYGSIDELINAGDKEGLTTLFNLLQNIKILDPAVGSAHFLESAINVLVDIYRKLRDRAKEVGIEKLEILVADEDGKIKPLNLLEIPEKEGLFEVYVKFFIILSRNIYGVDINPSALKVARARLFLTLARHFNVSAGVFIRFPNVHFNLREGNSLIGYVDVPRGRKETTQVTLDFNFEDHEIQYIREMIKVDDELKEYLPAIARSLRIEGDLVREVEEMNRILASKKIKWSEFEKVLKTKEKIIRVLVASLNSKYAVKLNNLLREITKLFNRKLDEKFAEEYGIDLDKLKKLKDIPWERKMFHWVFEFPEVFLEKKGFDVVIGNPPYGRLKQIIEDKKEKDFMSKIYGKLYSYQVGNLNQYKLFLERSYFLVSKGGYFSMIFPSSFLGENDSKELRKLFFEKAMVKKILEFPERARVFEGITQAVTILVYKKEIADQDYEFMLRTNIENRDMVATLSDFVNISRDDLKALTGDEYRIPLFTNPKIEWEILKHISKYPPFKGDENNPPIGDVGVGHLDETFDKEFMSDEPGDDLLIKGIHLDRYFVNLDPNGPKPRWIKNKEEFFRKKPEAKENIKFERIIGRNTINKASKPRLRFAILKPGYVITNNVKFIILKDKNIYKFYLIALLNSKILNWRFELFSFQNRVNNYEVEALPIPRIPLEDQKPFIILAKYMLFLKQYYNYFAKDDRHFQYIIDYFDNLIDCLVYELYLGDVVKIPIKPLVKDKLRDIELPDNLLEEDKNKIEKTLNEIKEVFNTLEKDKELNENLYLMKLHPWIKQIYTSLGG
ncbi:TaqI-like C-terminal specificity domain/Eco57I restriction-modification methylase [Geoglobus ahangari]|uniref:site-specific DNA-methyltransferase (adenine-specific) n=1 Tax=Geoglobus ahangari TaxID=113653 RepID=A0A0F7IF43_9EURY|nr:N-6 DNA methylase [Geoglobus ahangari]AKG91653.1 TaqI-like C-terminal specificity domain/Eco57I restriction-modification methylase [Geoglobus ahangari]